MERRLKRALLALLIAVTGLGAELVFGSPADQEKPAAGAQEHGVLLVELVKPLNSKNLQPGSAVEALVQARQNGMSIPHGSKVVGHVTEARARSKGDSESSLKIVFDRINPPGSAGPTSINAVIKAVAPNPNSQVSTGGNSVDYGVTMRSVMTSPPDMTKPPMPLLTNDSEGVLGFKNMSLVPDGLLTSGNKEVKLDGGTQLLLNVTIQ